MKKLVGVIVAVALLLAGLMYFLKVRQTWKPFEVAKESIEFVAEIYNQQKLFYAQYGSYTSDAKILFKETYYPKDQVNFKFGFIDEFKGYENTDDTPIDHNTSMFNSDRFLDITYTEDIKAIDFMKAALRNCPDAVVTKTSFMLCVIVPVDLKKNLYGVITIDEQKEVVIKELK